jgi:hypothetical protein
MARRSLASIAGDGPRLPARLRPAGEIGRAAAPLESGVVVVGPLLPPGIIAGWFREA